MKKSIVAIVMSLLFAILPFGAAAYNGEIVKFKMHDSKIYPGTQRNISVYVPKEYDGKTPACLWVSMSGGSFMFNILDKLIADGEIPVIIGVFVGPGQIRDAEGNVVRYNRSNELDRIDGRYAEFLETEVLPAVCKRKTTDGREIKSRIERQTEQSTAVVAVEFVRSMWRGNALTSSRVSIHFAEHLFRFVEETNILRLSASVNHDLFAYFCRTTTEILGIHFLAAGLSIMSWCFRL